MPSALIVTSTRSHVDSRETLRIQDIASVLIANDWRVDVLVPRASQLLALTLPPEVRVIRVPSLPFTVKPSPRPSFRRLLTGLLMILRGTALVSRRPYEVVHGLNDGALVARAIDRVTLCRFAYVADFSAPFGLRGFCRGVCANFVKYLERATMRHAAALVFSDADIWPRLEKSPPSARVAIIPDPHVELSAESFTPAEFADALAKVYMYATRNL